MSCKKKNYFYAVNSILPLTCGLFIYMTIKEDTLVSSYLSSLRFLMPIINYPAVIRNHAADFLWTYSLFFTLRLTLGDNLCGRNNLNVALLTITVAVIMECLQMTEIFHGTFDLLDIVAELLAVVSALLISNAIEHKMF